MGNYVDPQTTHHIRYPFWSCNYRDLKHRRDKNWAYLWRKLSGISLEKFDCFMDVDCVHQPWTCIDCKICLSRFWCDTKAMTTVGCTHQRGKNWHLSYKVTTLVIFTWVTSGLLIKCTKHMKEIREQISAKYYIKIWHNSRIIKMLLAYRRFWQLI